MINFYPIKNQKSGLTFKLKILMTYKIVRHEVYAD